MRSEVVVDLLDAAGIAQCLARVRPDAVVHCAAQPSVRLSWEYPAATYQTNVVGAGNLMEAVKGASDRVLLVGSAQQYGPCPPGHRLTETDPQVPDSPYAVTKIAQEQIGMMYMRRYGVQVIATRSFNHTGPGQSAEYAVGSFCSQLARMDPSAGGEMRVGNLDSQRDLLDVRDVVAAYARLLEAGEGGEVYNVCSGVAVSMGEVLGRLLDLSGMADRVVVHEAVDRRPEDPDLLVGDPSKIAASVGWAPTIPLETSLAETLDWYRSRMITDLA
jgi:GDP-4-dehydro-6-deoxy-D-mannose reductase